MKELKVKARLYCRDGIWYFEYRNPITGRRIRKTTKQHERAAAEACLNEELRAIGARQAGTTLRENIRLYTDPDTNPRKSSARVDGTGYGKEYADVVARHAAWFLKHIPDSLLDTEMGEIRAAQIRLVKEIIVNAMGHCRTAQFTFRTFKTIFTQAHEDGIIEFSPAYGMKDISYRKVPRDAVDSEYIALLLQAYGSFADIEDWAYFAIAASTGMRRSEILALHKEQIRGSILVIDRALKGTDPNVIGLPKRDKIRVISLPDIARFALSQIQPNKDGRYFLRARHWVDGSVRRFRAVASALYPQYQEIWDTITPHVLRHSLNSNLLAAGVPEILVAAYLGWEHQGLGDVQKGYTHIHASRLQPVAAAIDEMFGTDGMAAIEECRDHAKPAHR